MYQGKQQFDELQAETLRKATNLVEKHKVCTKQRLTQYKNWIVSCCYFKCYLGIFIERYM